MYDGHRFKRPAFDLLYSSSLSTPRDAANCFVMPRPRGPRPFVGTKCESRGCSFVYCRTSASVNAAPAVEQQQEKSRTMIYAAAKKRWEGWDEYLSKHPNA